MSEGSRELRVLYVEDCADQAALVRRWLGTLPDLYVVCASGAVEAMVYLTEEAFDVVISDMELGDGLGSDVIRVAQQRNPQVRAMLLTAHKRFDYAMLACERKVDAFLVKPLRRQESVEAVTQLCEASRKSSKEMRRPRTVLAIGAHPDDVEIGVGGTLLQHRDRGDKVIVLTLSGGEAGGVAHARAAEATASAARLGATLHLCDFKDREIEDGPATIDAIERVIKRYEPDVVYTHTSKDLHQDHRAVHQASLVAARNVPTVLCYQAPSSTTAFQPTMYNDIGEWMERKLELIALFRSQTSKCPYLEEDVIRSTARFWGRFANYRQVEPLEVLRTASVEQEEATTASQMPAPLREPELASRRAPADVTPLRVRAQAGAFRMDFDVA